MIRDVKASAPSRPWLHVVLPGRQPRAAPRPAGVHRQVQGQVRRRLRGLPRVGAAADDREGHPAGGHRAHADEPDARGHALAGDDVRPWDTLTADEKKLFSRMAEVYAGFSEYTDAQVGRIIDYLEKTGQLDNTLIFYCADNGASGEGTPERIGQREQVLQRLSGRDVREPQASRRPGQPEHLQPLSDRLGDGVLDAVQDVQALQLPGRHLRPDGHPLAEGHQGARARCATSTTTRPTSCRRSSSACGLEMPKVLNGRRAGPAARQSRCVLASTRRRADAEEAPVLRDARHARDLGGRLEGRRRPRADIGQRPFRQGRVGAVPRRRRPRASRRIWPTRNPRS